jgi:putative endonuclease
MNFHVYILQSKTTGKYYCGQTDDLAARLTRHNSCLNNYTSHGIPWELVISYQVNTRSEAMILEKEIKKRGIGRFLKDHQT